MSLVYFVECSYENICQLNILMKSHLSQQQQASRVHCSMLPEDIYDDPSI